MYDATQTHKHIQTHATTQQTYIYIHTYIHIYIYICIYIKNAALKCAHVSLLLSAKYKNHDSLASLKNKIIISSLASSLNCIRLAYVSNFVNHKRAFSSCAPVNFDGAKREISALAIFILTC